MSVDHPKYNVFWNGSTELAWWFDSSKINLVRTNKNVNKSKQFQSGDLVLGLDGFIRKKSYKNKFHKHTIPKEIILTEEKNGWKMCSCCVKVKTIDEFSQHLQKYNNKKLNKQCSNCNNNSIKSYDNKENYLGKRAEYIRWRRIELIRKTGCVCQKCDLNKYIPKWNDDFILGIFELNHRDGGLTKLQCLCEYRWFTDAEALKQGFKNWKELWEAEAAKCEVLCRGHHILFTKEDAKNKRQKRS